MDSIAHIDGARVLVTGGAGMIGSNLVRRLRAEGADVLVVDSLWRGRLENLCDEDGRPFVDLERDFHRLDLAVPGAMDGLLLGVDYVYHLADVVAGIGYVFDNQGSIFRQNVLINSNVVSSVRERPVAGFVYVGTACSFPAHLQSGTDAAPLREEDLYPASPESAYGWSKLMGQYESDLLELERGMPVSVLMLHNVYGTPTDYSDKRGQVIPSLVRKAIAYPDEPFVVGQRRAGTRVRARRRRRRRARGGGAERVRAGRDPDRPRRLHVDPRGGGAGRGHLGQGDRNRVRPLGPGG